ncbi:hypothetical protein ACEUC3_00320 [Aeromonas bivalvium]|uniref:hypothetical protein n=1 Tax=Aeromonas bivalvium TaxID=440079 RepID=UPI0013A6B8B1|nr:hypothetical protein [Aeromonas bivalvium]
MLKYFPAPAAASLFRPALPKKAPPEPGLSVQVTAKCLPNIFALEPTPLDRYVVFLWFYEPGREEKVPLTY